MAGCRAYTELEAEKLTCEIVELENSVMHLVSLRWCPGVLRVRAVWGKEKLFFPNYLPCVAIYPRHGRSLNRSRKLLAAKC